MTVETGPVTRAERTEAEVEVLRDALEVVLKMDAKWRRWSLSPAQRLDYVMHVSPRGARLGAGLAVLHLDRASKGLYRSLAERQGNQEQILGTLSLIEDARNNLLLAWPAGGDDRP